jgi:hypothetical protein
LKSNLREIVARQTCIYRDTKGGSTGDRNDINPTGRQRAARAAMPGPVALRQVQQGEL